EHLVDVGGHGGVDASTIGVARDRGDATDEDGRGLRNQIGFGDGNDDGGGGGSAREDDGEQHEDGGRRAVHDLPCCSELFRKAATPNAWGARAAPHARPSRRWRRFSAPR